jgi:hypothetical protein
LSSLNIFYVVFFIFYIIFFLIRIFDKSKIQFFIIKKVERIEGRNIEKGYYETKILFGPWRWFRKYLSMNSGNELQLRIEIIQMRKPTILEMFNKYYMKTFIFLTQELNKKKIFDSVNSLQNIIKENKIQNYNVLLGVGVSVKKFIEKDILTKNLSKREKIKVEADLRMAMEKHPGIIIVTSLNENYCTILRTNLTTNRNDQNFILNNLGVTSEISNVKGFVNFGYIRDLQICIFKWSELGLLIKEGLIYTNFVISKRQTEELDYSLTEGITKGEIMIVDNIVNGKKYSMVYNKNGQPLIRIMSNGSKNDIITVFKRENMEMNNLRLPKELIEDYTKIIEKLENKD